MKHLVGGGETALKLPRGGIHMDQLQGARCAEQSSSWGKKLRSCLKSGRRERAQKDPGRGDLWRRSTTFWPEGR